MRYYRVVVVLHGVSDWISVRYVGMLALLYLVVYCAQIVLYVCVHPFK